MFNPKDPKSAKIYRYNRWVGNPKGTEFDPERCYVECSDSSGWHFHQCPNKAKEDGLCGPHRNQLKRCKKGM